MGAIQFTTPEARDAVALGAWRESVEASAFQAKQALEDFALLAQVETMMDDPATPSKTKRAWAEAQVFRWRSPTVQEMAAALGLTDNDLDDLFKHARTIEA